MHSLFRNAWRTTEDHLRPSQEKQATTVFPEEKSHESRPPGCKLKEDRSLWRLFISSQNRDGDRQNFSKHENQPWPPSLSQYGELRSGTKFDFYNA